ncbi:putative TIM-barrel fold metal-dependent hydrolase [Kitasatospora sp. MAP12-15]|uniref:amidohydrolase family protein n=1 Tax=unclassified Kitasatospora TaxID=2633591 RepID=UPI002473C1E5|nr:amidohydrolase family protein [Kitasatospora sp. MAP12-44]MDH6113468.1 putative TIM-barrel fold metal-dependent hydrolase [Kitasatospora sp. MAP12-44]
MPPPLLDQHCHSLVVADLDEDAFGALLTESDRPPRPGDDPFDSTLGLAVRRWCPPALGLPAHADGADYLARRRALGPQQATRRLLAAAGLDTLLVDTGLTHAAGQPLLSLPELAAVSGARVREVVRLESIAQALAARAPAARDWPAALRDALSAALVDAVAVKSVLAYRHGLDIPAERVGEAEAVQAAAVQLAHPTGPLTDPVLLRQLLWTAVDLCARRTPPLPLQLHTGFGDPDLTLHRADPSLLTPFIRAVEPTGVPLVLLHGYPYHRQVGWLAQAFPHVYADVGLTVGYTGAQAATVLGELLELAPFSKVLFSTDAYGLPELYLVGAAQFRHSLAALLAGWQADDACTRSDAAHLTQLISSTNTRRLYGL